MIIVILVEVGIDHKFMQIGFSTLRMIQPRDTEQVPRVGVAAMLPANLNLKFTAPEWNYANRSEVCHPRCVLKPCGEVNSVKNTTMNKWLNDGVY